MTFISSLIERISSDLISCVGIISTELPVPAFLLFLPVDKTKDLDIDSNSLEVGVTLFVTFVPEDRPGRTGEDSDTWAGAKPAVMKLITMSTIIVR
jgi:hypothetical protein